MCHRVRAAYMVGSKVYSGTSHTEIYDEIGEKLFEDRLRHGYVDQAGNFYENLKELLENMTETIIIRHAETFYNRNESTDLDSNLTPRGIKQAEGVAAYLAESKDGQGFTGFVSPFLRTLETALAIHKATGIPFKVYPSICEYGANWSRVPYRISVPSRQESYPMFDWSLFSESKLFTSETFEQFLDRIKAVAAVKRPEKSLFVSHGAVVYTLTDLFTDGKHFQEQKVKGYHHVTNACITKISGSKPVYVFKNNWKGDES